MTTSFTEMQADPEKPPYPKKEGWPPLPRMNLRTASSISLVVTPGRTILPASARAWAVIRPALRMASCSRGDFKVMSSISQIPRIPAIAWVVASMLG